MFRSVALTRCKYMRTCLIQFIQVWILGLFDDVLFCYTQQKCIYCFCLLVNLPFFGVDKSLYKKSFYQKYPTKVQFSLCIYIVQKLFLCQKSSWWVMEHVENTLRNVLVKYLKEIRFSLLGSDLCSAPMLSRISHQVLCNFVKVTHQ